MLTPAPSPAGNAPRVRRPRSSRGLCARPANSVAIRETRCRATQSTNSDAGSQYTSIHFGETLLLEGLVPSIGTVADAYDNALAETTIGLFKTECYRPGSPFLPHQPRTLAELEDAVATWVHWYNNDRLMHRLGLIPPLEFEAAYYAAQRSAKQASALTTECASNPA